MTVEDNFNEQVLKIWRQHLKKPALMPAHYPPGHFKQNLKLLMLGMNPAFSERSIQKRLMGLDIDLQANDVFGWSPEAELRYVDQLILAESDAFESYRRFFEPLRRFAETIGCAASYSHLTCSTGGRPSRTIFSKSSACPAH